MISRFSKFLVPVLVLFAAASCGKVNVEALKTTNTVALVSVFGKESVDVSKATGGSVAGLISKAAQGDEASMAGRMENVKDVILKETPSILGLKVVPEKSVINAKSYQAIDDKNANRFGGFVKAKGYKQIMGNETAKIVQALEAVKNADAAMIVTFDTRLVKRGGIVGNENGYMWGDMTFYLYDRQGQLILHKTVSNESDTITKIRMGAFSAEPFDKMIAETITKNLKSIKEFIDKSMEQKS
jgi:hypothetical protein